MKKAAVNSAPAGTPRFVFLRGVAMGWVAKLSAALVGLALTPLLIRQLGERDFGVYVLLTGLTPWLATLDVGFIPALRVLLARELGSEAERRSSGEASTWIATTWFGQCALLSGLGVFAVIAAPRLLGWFGIFEPDGLSLFRLLVVAFVVSKIGQVFGAILTANNRVDVDQAGRVAQTLTRAALLAVALALAGNLRGLGYAWVVAATVAALWLALRSRDYLPSNVFSWRNVRWARGRGLFAHGVWLSFGALAGLLIVGADRAVVARFISLEAVTRFSVTASLYVLAEALLNHFVDAARPGLAHRHGRGDLPGARAMYGGLRRSVMVLGLAAALLLIVVNQTFVGLWVGPEQYGGRLLDAALAVNFALQTALAPVRASLAAALVIRPATLCRAGEGVLNLLLSIALIPHLGLAGVALGTAAATLASSAWYLPLLARRTYGANLDQQSDLAEFLEFSGLRSLKAKS